MHRLGTLLVSGVGVCAESEDEESKCAESEDGQISAESEEMSKDKM